MKLFLAALALALTSSLSVADQNSSRSSQAADHKTRLPQDLVSYFIGDWTGKGKFRNGRDVESDFSFVPQLENQWVLVHQKEKLPNTFEFSALLSVDSNLGDVVMALAGDHDTGA